MPSGTRSPADAAQPRTGPVWQWFTDEEAIRTVDILRLVFVGVAAGAFVLTEIGRTVYRPFIYESGIGDFGIADSIGNLGGIIVQIFLSLALLNSKGRKAFHVIGFLVVGYMLYEIVQHYLPRSVFDPKDIYGTVIGGALAAALLLVLRRFVRPNRVLFRL